MELISPEFSYQSDFLLDWYTTRLQPTPVDEARVTADNQVRSENLKVLQTAIAAVRAEMAALDLAMALARDKDADLILWNTDPLSPMARRVKVFRMGVEVKKVQDQ